METNYYNPVEYWRTRISSHGFINTTKTGMSKDEFDFCTKYIKYNDRVLDFGCGDGKLFPVFDLLKCNVIGLDIVDLSESLNKNIKENHFEFDFKYRVKDDVSKLTEFSYKQFDVVCCINVIAHITPSDIDMVLNDLIRIGKRVLITAYENKQDRDMITAKHCFNHDYENILNRNKIKHLEYNNINNISWIVL